MMDFKVEYEYENGYDYVYGISKVYAIDSVRDRFLVADKDGDFRWISTDECTLVTED